jgi:undecaprenyl diphosphate synthase
VELDGLDPNRMPRHVACVMDGNGRWATKQGLPRTEGHRAGEEALFDAACGALDLGIAYFTVYAFSTENWRRPHEEVRFLLTVIADQLLTRRRDELHRMGVRIRFIGRRDWRVPRWVARRMDEATALTERNQAMTLTGRSITVAGPRSSTP